MVSIAGGSPVTIMYKKNTYNGAHRGCMKTANALRAMPAADGPAAARTQCGVACSSPPDCTCKQEVFVDGSRGADYVNE